jgi:molybdenum cofactor biosynthesis protein MoaC
LADFSHTDKHGKAIMVDVSGKSSTDREAEAEGTVQVSRKVYRAIENNEVKKGDVLSVAKIAGIQAAKRTSELIPLCHNIFISNIDIQIELKNENRIIVRAYTKTNAQTGIEMEAMTAVSVACLTIYDMCKAIDKSIIIGDIKLVRKSGGKSGNYLISELFTPHGKTKDL